LFAVKPKFYKDEVFRVGGGMGGWVGLRNGWMGGFKEWVDGWGRERR
jgi:hypothetical protein